MHSSNASRALGSEATGFANLEEHLAKSVRHALETLQTADGGVRSHFGASGSAAAAAVAATGMSGGTMSCVQKPTDGYWHIMYTCVIKIRGTDFFLDVRCGDQGPKSGRLIASAERAGVFKVCVRHLLKSARDFYDSLKVLWWQPMPVVVFDGLLPSDELLRRNAEKELEKRRKRNKKKNRRRRGRGNDAQSSAETTVRAKHAQEAHTACEAGVDLLTSSSAGVTPAPGRESQNSKSKSPQQGNSWSPAGSRSNADAARVALGDVPSSSHASSTDDRSSVCNSGSDTGSAVDGSKRKADYSEWDVVALMYIGSLDAETPVAQFQSLHTNDAGSASPKNAEDCWYISNSKAALPLCRGCRGTATADTDGHNSKGASFNGRGGHSPNRCTRSREREKGGCRSSSRCTSPCSEAALHEASLERAFDRACQLCLNNRLTPHEAFIVKRADRERGCFPLYHKIARRYLYAHPTNGLVGMVPSTSTVVAATAQKIMTDIKSKKADGRSSMKREAEEDKDSDSRPLLCDEKTATGKEQHRAEDGWRHDGSGRQVFMPSEFELIALSDLMIQQTVAQIIASLPPVESPRARWDGLGSWGMEDTEGEEDEDEKDRLENGSRPTTVSSDEDECRQRGSASSLPYSGDDDQRDRLSCTATTDRHDSISNESFIGEQGQGTSDSFIPSSPEAFSSATERGAISSEDDDEHLHGRRGLRIRMVPLSGERPKRQNESPRRRQGSDNTRRSSRKNCSVREPLEDSPEDGQQTVSGVCDQFVLSDLDAETDLEEETGDFGVSQGGGGTGRDATRWAENQ
ncbi:conserved hypothetical protein [Neospora caninum Liverpool]|nr:conserved hypothetical protein [Neospora caninum Liverpool]CBZ52337.1 conserved hypothetical protein [Neospora caninum Liverpool]|eukprot:XP_003882369.1 conserved hypothetical protein [Neospora caninum Liverpool]